MRRMLTALVAASLLMPASAALGAGLAPTESYAALLHQIDTHRVVLAYINQRTHDIRVTLKGGVEERAVFPAAQHKVLVDALFDHGVTPKFTKAPTTTTHVAKHPHHLLRYIAAGVVVVLLIAGGAIWIYTRGERPPEEGSHSGEPADGTT